MNKEQIALKLYDLGVLKFGSFTLKSGLTSPFYLDFRIIVAYPEILKQISIQLWNLVKDDHFDHLCGVPYAALSLSSSMAVINEKSMIVKRKEQKQHGTKRLVEGIFKKDDTCVVIDDVISSGISMIETLESLETEGLVIKDVLSIVDRMQGGSSLLATYGYNVKTVYTMRELLDIMLKNKKISSKVYTDTLAFIETNRIDFEQVRERRKYATAFSYSAISKGSKCKVTQRLTEIIQAKKSNLCCSADVTTSAQLLDLAKKVGPSICMLKTHMDNIHDFYPELPYEVKKIAEKHNFLLFEDRKFADIGHIVMQQFTAAPLSIADWADVVTVHVVAGSSSIESLIATKKMEGKAMIIVAEMSTKDTLTDKKYTLKALDIADRNCEYVLGVVAQTHRPNNPGIMLLTPGISLTAKSDKHGQRYGHPDEAFVRRGIDVMIVGRGIYRDDNPKLRAEMYRKIGWEAYTKRKNKE